MKPGPNYKMSRAAKTMLARNWANPNLTLIRKATILGELKAREIVRSKRDRSEDRSND